MDSMNAMLKRISLLLIVLVGTVLAGCQGGQAGSFAIYLLAEDIPATQISQMDIGELMLQDKPLISGDDIVSYDQSTHTIELTREAYERVQQIFPMPVEVDGIPFVVCVGNERIYTGAFWTPLSSISYDGVIIMQPFDPNGTTIQIALGYPSPEVFTGDDPRDDPRILKALEQSRKLK
jgi:hypothetical protein